MMNASSQHEAPWRSGLPLPIQTARLVLRPCREGDGVALAAAVAESYGDLHPWFHDGMRTREDEIDPIWQEVVVCRSLAQFKSRERLQFLAFSKEEELIGSIELFEPDWRRRAFRLAYWVRSGAQRRGYGMEANIAVLRFAFDVLKARRMTVGHAAPNVASARLIKKLGFGDLSRMPLGSEMPGARFVDGISYVMTDDSRLPTIPVSWG